MRRIHIALFVILGCVSTARSEETLRQYPTWGVAFAWPGATWTIEWPNSPSTIAQWYVRGSGQTRPPSISVTAATTEDTLDKLVAGWEKDWGGKLREFTVAGERAFEMTEMKPYEKAPNVPSMEIIVGFMRGKVLYRVGGFATKEQSTKADIEKILASWKWIDLEPTAKHLYLSPPVRTLKDGFIHASLPNISYVFVGAGDPNKLFVGIQNVAMNKLDYSVELEFRTKVPKLTGEELGKVCIENQWFRFKPEGDVAWKTLKGPLKRTMSAPFTATKTPDPEFDDPDAAEVKQTRMVGVVELDQERFIKVSAILPSPRPDDHPLFAAMTEKIAESIALAPPPATAPATAPAPTTQPLVMGAFTKYPTWGIALTPPGGAWQPILTHNQTWMAEWIRPTAPDRPTKSIIAVIARTVKGDQPAALSKEADEWKKTFNGDRRELTVAGEPAFEITHAAGPKGFIAPEKAVIVAHNNVLYTIMGTPDTGRTVAPEIAAMCASWKWIEREAVVKHLDLAAQPMTVLGGAVTVKVPRMAFIKAGPDDKSKFRIGLQNILTNSTDFTYGLEYLAKKPGVPLHVFAEQEVDSIKKQWATDPMPILRELTGSTPRMITQPFFITIPERKDAEGKVQPAVKMVKMYGFAGFDDQKVLFISASLTSPTTHDNVHFLKLVEQMTESIAIVGKK